MLSKNINDVFSKSTLLLLAIFLQIQITLFETDSYIGLRANLADLLLPFIGLFILATLLSKRSLWPEWEKPFGYWAPILLTLIIAFALVNGYRLQGSFNVWAFGNKGIGWLVLMAYLALAAWFATNRPFDEIRRYFFRPFVVFLCFVTVAEIIVRLLIHYKFIQAFTLLDALKVSEISGFMGNRNAFGFLYFSTLAMTSVFLVKDFSLKKIELFCFRFLWLLSPILIIMNTSRSTLLIFILIIVILGIINWRNFLKKILPLLLLGIFLVPLADSNRTAGYFQKVFYSHQHHELVLENKPKTNDLQTRLIPSDKLRYDVMIAGFELFKQDPITGSGLGSTYKQQSDNPNAVSVIHNTALWILFEMGPFGLLAFAGVFSAIMIVFYKKAKDDQSAEGVFALGVLLSLVAFGAFSLFHEILYTRFFWVFLGLALAVPCTKKHQN